MRSSIDTSSPSSVSSSGHGSNSQLFNGFGCTFVRPSAHVCTTFLHVTTSSSISSPSSSLSSSPSSSSPLSSLSSSLPSSSSKSSGHRSNSQSLNGFGYTCVIPSAQTYTRSLHFSFFIPTRGDACPPVEDSSMKRNIATVSALTALDMCMVVIGVRGPGKGRECAR
ncbi:hypothetical protein H310_04639 [Aphanomyces invadans]|uniref:Uncharacterized protein n=1 Tax=Aphanomyces invadans TaxID=157072 RepID=A0A024UFD4_9STRA|nr:hypothetical protein H310_04639 [Aphanomyces invadans]ETW04343.1 hypothetical protein H310_04639 [Aphanomyces invadans]|eukprot:XP_008867299.1 hypothetical protein H310_04639 [Aphanomyces invadans]